MSKGFVQGTDLYGRFHVQTPTEPDHCRRFSMDQCKETGCMADYRHKPLWMGTAAARQRGAAATLRRASPGSGLAARLACRALPKYRRQYRFGNKNALICARHTQPGRQRACFVPIKVSLLRSGKRADSRYNGNGNHRPEYGREATFALNRGFNAMHVQKWRQKDVGDAPPLPLLHQIVASVQYMCRSGDNLQCNTCADVADKDKRKHKFFRIFAADMRKRISSCICSPRPKLWHYYRNQRYFINT